MRMHTLISFICCGVLRCNLQNYFMFIDDFFFVFENFDFLSKFMVYIFVVRVGETSKEVHTQSNKNYE